MQFTFTEEQAMMAEMTRKLLVAECTSARLRGLLAQDQSFDANRWEKLMELGLAGALVPEAKDGLGLACADFVQIAEACGYVALPEPLVELVGMTLPLLAELDAPDLLARAMSGQAFVALAHHLNPVIVDADRAEAILRVGRDRIDLIPAAAAQLTLQPSVDPLRRLFTMRVDETQATALAEGGKATKLSLEAADRAALFAAAQMLGMAQRCVDLSVAYTSERKQFGKPIGSYQAVKHLLANAQVKIEFARPVLFAAAALHPGAGTATAARISHAKLACGEAADLAARNAVQVHGGMGYSWEVDVHFYLKRTLALTNAWGAPEYHRDRMAARVFGAPFEIENLFPQEG